MKLLTRNKKTKMNMKNKKLYKLTHLAQTPEQIKIALKQIDVNAQDEYRKSAIMYHAARLWNVICSRH